MSFVSRTGFALLALVGLAITPVTASAQDYPSRPLTMVVPTDPGGSVDRIARGLAPFLSQTLGQPITVINQPGVGGQVGTTWFLQQPDDGYTIMMAPATPYIPNNILMTGATYTLDDFAFINGQWSDYAFLAVPKDSPYKTAGELLDAIKANPGTVTSGVTFGSAGHILTIILLEKLGVGPEGVRLVTFDGGGSLRTAIAGAQVDFSFVQAEGSETIIDLIDVLALVTDEPKEGFDAPLINEVLAPYNIEMPILSGTVRTLTAHASFRDNHPEDYAKLTDAYKAALELPEYQAWLTENKIGGDWLGPERTTAIIQENFDILSEYKGLLQ